jgi:hypothetical protein
MRATSWCDSLGKVCADVRAMARHCEPNRFRGSTAALAPTTALTTVLLTARSAGTGNNSASGPAALSCH